MHNAYRAGTGAADLVLIGGRVHTVDADDWVAEAIAVSGNRVTRVGTAAAVAGLVGPGTQVVDLAGRTVLPGINDSHLHGAWLGSRWPSLLMDEMAAGPAPGPGGGGDSGGDADSGTGPGSGPGGGTGAGPGAGTAPPAADPHAAAGDPHTAPARVRLTDTAQRRGAILRTAELLRTLGVTSYTEPGLGPGEDDGPTGCFGTGVLREYADLAAEGLLTARVTALTLFGELDGRSTAEDMLRGIADFRPPAPVPGWFAVPGVKVFADGIPPMGTAWTHEPYAAGGHGSLLVAGADEAERQAALVAVIDAAHAAGQQVAVHATGSRSTAVVAAAMAAARARDGRDLRHYLIHGDLLHPGTLRAMAAAGIGLNTQPGIAAATAGMLAGALGPDVLAHAWPVASALAAGVPLCLSSDSPVLTPDWRVGLAAALTRRDPVAEGAAGTGTGQRLTLAQALRAYTATPARQDGAEAWKGTLERGKVADLCVLEADLREVDPAALPSVAVDLTVVDGRIVYER